MALGQDISYSHASKIYTKQQPDGTTINGGTVTTERVNDAGSLVQDYGARTLNGQILPAKLTFTIAPKGTGGSNETSVIVTVQDGNGNTITGVAFLVDLWLSDDASGLSITATTASGAVAVATGVQIAQDVTKKYLRVITATSGTVEVDITDTSKTGFYIAANVRGIAFPSVSRQLVAADYS